MRQHARFFGILALFVMVLAGVWLGAEFALPRLARAALSREIRRGCPTCEVKIDALNLSLLSGQLDMGQVHYRMRLSNHLMLTATLQELHTKLNWSGLLHHRLKVGAISLHAPAVQINEDVETDLPKVRSSPSDHPWIREVRFGPIAVAGGRFAFIEKRGPTSGKLKVDQIRGRMNHLVFKPKTGEVRFEFDSLSRLEKTGNARLWASVRIRKSKTIADLKLEAHDQDLEGLSDLFAAMSGVQVQGWLHEGFASLELEDDILRGTLSADYDRLKLHFSPGPGHGELTTDLSNLAERFSIRSKNREIKAGRLSQEVKAERKKYESSISLILRGLQDAATSEATS